MLNQVLVDMKTQLVEAKKQVAVAIGDEKRPKSSGTNRSRSAKTGNAKRCSRCRLATMNWPKKRPAPARTRRVVDAV